MACVLVLVVFKVYIKALLVQNHPRRVARLFKAQRRDVVSVPYREIPFLFHQQLVPCSTQLALGLVIAQEELDPNSVAYMNNSNCKPHRSSSNFQSEANARLKARVDPYLAENLKENLSDIGFCCCISKWVENDNIRSK
ncbi:hypothetical protein F442_07173 [Phytophthora nicotianae P10297]|uniref:Uncharacterized protein n=1 Tax=Phytophthora nicotianae P10297 TaxID=1317064 RepID=W2ZHR9_PHYNI|nr:hypothetical protein F442_07173 [Phytophthora nicotianae P10297]